MRAPPNPNQPSRLQHAPLTASQSRRKERPRRNRSVACTRSTREAVCMRAPSPNPKQVAERLYKRARKLRRAVEALEPLIARAEEEVEYLGEVEAAVGQLGAYGGPEDTAAVLEVQVSGVCLRVLLALVGGGRWRRRWGSWGRVRRP